ncbi:MAG: hypothetical protein ABIR08_11635 [Sphingomonas sp.]
MATSMRIVTRDATDGISFADYANGIRLNELVESIARALGTTAHRPKGSPLELLIGFEGYPEGFELWWDGFTCELGCSSPCGVDMDKIVARLLASQAFVVA